MSESLGNNETQLSSEQLLGVSGEFLQHFAVDADPHDASDQFLESLRQIDPRYKDGRHLVRFELEADQTEWDEHTKDIIMRTAEGMRMLVPETPLPNGIYDTIIALGGARQAPLDRTRYAADAIAAGDVKTKRLIVAGSDRKLNEVEQENVANYAPHATTEYELCVSAVMAVAAENPDSEFQVMRIKRERADTPDVIDTVFRKLNDKWLLRPFSRFAVVTTQIYQSSTGRDFARVAEQFGVTETFTAGNPSDPNVVANRKPATYLSEVLRTLRAVGNDIAAQK